METVKVICIPSHLTVKLALWQRFNFDEARLIQLEDVLEIRLLQAPTEDGAVLPVEHGFLVDLVIEQNDRNYLLVIFDPPSLQTQ